MFCCALVCCVILILAIFVHPGEYAGVFFRPHTVEGLMEVADLFNVHAK